MTDTYYPDQIIHIRGESNRERARDRYRSVFDVAVSSKKIDKAIQKYVDEAIDGMEEAAEEYDTDYLVEIPFSLLLAVTLRKGFAHGPGRSRRSREETRKLWRAIRFAERRKAEYVRRISRGKATRQAVNDAANRYGISASIIEDQMGRAFWRNSLEYVLRNNRSIISAE